MLAWVFALAPIFLDTNLGLNRVWKEGLEMLKVKDASGVAPGFSLPALAFDDHGTTNLLNQALLCDV